MRQANAIHVSNLRRLKFGLVAGCLVVATVGCRHETENLIALPEVSAATTPALAPTGEATVSTLRLDQWIHATGTIEPARVVELGAPYMARVEAVNVSEGDIVEKDAVLVQLDTTLPRQQAAQANAQAAANRVQAQQAADEIERLLPLVARGVVAEQQVDALEAQRAALDESVDAVEAMASLARAQRADGSIRAPFAGTVTAVPLEVGAIASPGAPLVRLLDMSEVDVRVSLSEAEMSAVAVGDIVRIRVPGAGIEREGHIRFVDPELDPATRLGEVLVRVENSDRRLLAGSFAAVTAPRANTAEVLIVPPDAILRTAAGASVFVVTPSGFERRTVVVERLSDGQWAVASGLVAGERVATGALSGLAATSTVVAVEGGAP